MRHFVETIVLGGLVIGAAWGIRTMWNKIADDERSAATVEALLTIATVTSVLYLVGCVAAWALGVVL
jgi:hypothetical protein